MATLAALPPATRLPGRGGPHRDGQGVHLPGTTYGSRPRSALAQGLCGRHRAAPGEGDGGAGGPRVSGTDDPAPDLLAE
jgi:hypothetical protein